MRTDHLIQALVEDIRPVRRLRSVDQRYLRWISMTLLLVMFGTLVCGLRPDLSGKSHDTFFLLEGGSLLFLFATAARSAFQLSVPDDDRPVSAIFYPLLAFILWFSLLIVHYWSGTGTVGTEFETGPKLLCVFRILGLGMLPGIACLISLRRAAPQKKRWAGFFMTLAAFSVAALGTQALCAIDRPLHILIWHFLPVLFAAILGAGLGELAFKRRGFSVAGQ